MRWAALFCALFSLYANPAMAHVKWFLGHDHSHLLNHPKPAIFCELTVDNITIVGAAIVMLYIAARVSREFAGAAWNLRLIEWSTKGQQWISLLMGIFTGSLLLYCAHEQLLFVPNMPLEGEHASLAAGIEAAVGVGFILGLFSRLCALALLGGLVASFSAYDPSDCLDLLPMYGLVSYFLLAGRGKWSIDHLIGLDPGVGPYMTFWSYRLLRWFTGGGLVVLGLNEKLLHPQLALHLIEHRPSLNFMQFAGMSDATFVFCAGVTEVVLGLLIVSGTLPRLGILFLAGMFAVTPMIFGVEELWGHMAYYGLVVALLLRGNGELPRMNFKIAVLHVVPYVVRLMPGRKVA